MSDAQVTEPSEPVWLWVTNCAGSNQETALRMYRMSFQSHEFAVGKPRRTLIHDQPALVERGVVGIYGRAGTNAERAAGE